MKQVFKAGLISVILSASSLSMAASYVNPLTFDGSDSQKKAVISFIEQEVHRTYCGGLGQCSPSVLRMMEQEELRAFKYLTTNATNQQIYQMVFDTYARGLGQYSYSTIKMMYDEEVKKAGQKLQW